MENRLLVLMFVDDLGINISNTMLWLISQHSQKLKGGTIYPPARQEEEIILQYF